MTGRSAVLPTFVFLIDTSLHAFECGFLHHTLSSIKSCMENIVQPDISNICIVTFDSTIHFFSIPADENAEPTILNVGDVNNAFVPLPFEKLCLNVGIDKERINNLLDKIYNFYSQEWYAQGR